MTTSTFDLLNLEHGANGISILTINRPDKLNALNRILLEELDQAINLFEQSDEARILVLTGAGDKAFVAGADIKELSTLTKTEGENVSAYGQAVFGRIELSSKPIIALINGYALGGGAELAMACHIRIATENALIGLPEVSLGLIPGYGGTQRLTQLIGKSKAMEMILTGQPIKADEAKEVGLVNEVCSSDEALNYARSLAEKMLKNGPVALSKAIEAIHFAYSENGYAKEATLFGELCETEDFQEGTKAFLEKRKADFKGK
ncbi:MAG: enoyl-CoA hydratase-related protein [Balneolaceae bacterium]